MGWLNDWFDRLRGRKEKSPSGTLRGGTVVLDPSELDKMSPPPESPKLTPSADGLTTESPTVASTIEILQKNDTVLPARPTVPYTFTPPTQSGDRPGGRARPPRPFTDYEPFHQFWGWVEETSEYEELYAISQRMTPGTHCPACGGDTAGEDYFSLCNAWRVHQRCYDTLHDRLSKVQSIEEAQELFKQNPQAAAVFRLIHTYWWDYPPDWPVRRDMVIEATDGGCSICGKKKDLDVHHERPKSRGGDHALENLICLCHDHHQAAHKWNIDSIPEETAASSVKPKPQLMEIIDLLNRAIDAKGKVSFDYIDKACKHTKRTVSPNGWKKYGRYGLCVTAYCHLRKAPREFNIRRMSNVT